MGSMGLAGSAAAVEARVKHKAAANLARWCVPSPTQPAQ